jgi:hypothetical protein
MGARCDDGRRGIIFFGARRRWQKLIFHNTSGDCSCSCVSQSKEKNCILRVTFLLAGNNERRAVAFICFMARRLSHLASTIKSKQEINYLLHAECRRAGGRRWRTTDIRPRLFMTAGISLAGSFCCCFPLGERDARSLPIVDASNFSLCLC